MTTLAEHKARIAGVRRLLRKHARERQQKFADDPNALGDMETNRAVLARTVALEHYVDRLEQVVQNDRDADLVWLGSAYATAFAIYHDDVLAKAVQRRRLKRTHQTKNANLEERNADLAARYHAYVDGGHNDLQARQRLRDETGHSLKVLKAAIAAKSRRA